MEKSTASDTGLLLPNSFLSTIRRWLSGFNQKLDDVLDVCSLQREMHLQEFARVSRVVSFRGAPPREAIRLSCLQHLVALKNARGVRGPQFFQKLDLMGSGGRFCSANARLQCECSNRNF